MTFGPIVSVDWLAEHLHDPDLRILDFRWTLAGGSAVDRYAEAHIPAAVFVPMEAVTGQGPGRHPLPSREQFETAMRAAGVNDASRVVVYDEIGGSVASRLWFLLRWFGHPEQAVLDGGIKSWNRELESDVPATAPGDFHAQEGDAAQIVEFEAVRKLPPGVVLLDSRLGERYRGETEPVDPKAGHIPGAISAPYPENLDSNGRFLAPAELKKRFQKLGVKRGKKAIVYCGSGVNATHNLLAMALAGIDDVRLYNGSWSDWSSRDAPVATGPDPG